MARHVDQLFLRSALAGRANRRRGPPPRRQKLGVTIDEAVCVLPDFRYHASAADGTVENEICPVFCARAVDSVRPAPDGVMDYRWFPGWTYGGLPVRLGRLARGPSADRIVGRVHLHRRWPQFVRVASCTDRLIEATRIKSGVGA